MTDESPKQRKQPSGIACDDCGHKLVVDRNRRGTLVVSCGCDEVRPIKVSRVLPDGWQE